MLTALQKALLLMIYVLAGSPAAEQRQVLGHDCSRAIRILHVVPARHGVWVGAAAGAGAAHATKRPRLGECTCARHPPAPAAAPQLQQATAPGVSAEELWGHLSSVPGPGQLCVPGTACLIVPDSAAVKGHCANPAQLTDP